MLSEDFVKKIVISVGLMLPSANCGSGGGEGATREKWWTSQTQRSCNRLEIKMTKKVGKALFHVSIHIALTYYVLVQSSYWSLLSYLAQELLSSNGIELTHCTSCGNVHLRRRETFVRHEIKLLYCSLIIAPWHGGEVCMPWWPWKLYHLGTGPWSVQTCWAGLGERPDELQRLILQING